MAILLNKTARVIIVGGDRLVPATPVSLNLSEAEIKKMYPFIADMAKQGKIEFVTAKEAKQAEDDLAEKTIAELKAYAAAKGIQLNGATRKDDILEAIKAG